MRRSFLGRVIPAALTAVGVAVPSTTAAIVMLHSMIPRSAASGAVPASSTVANPPAPVTPTPRPAATPKTRLVATPKPRLTTATRRTISGPAETDQYGQVQATITVAGRKITSVSISAPQDNPRSAEINQQAVPLLRTETLQAQSANVNLISGATITSDAYIQSLQGALQTAGI